MGTKKIALLIFCLTFIFNVNLLFAQENPDNNQKKSQSQEQQKPSIVENREPLKAGVWYEKQAQALEKQIEKLLAQSDENNDSDANLNAKVKAVIVPYGDYKDVGEIMGKAYANLQKIAGNFKRILIIGNDEKPKKDEFNNVRILIGAQNWLTPLGKVEVDAEEVQRLAFLFGNEGFLDLDQNSLGADSIEAQLPFIQKIFNDKIKIVPVVIARKSAYSDRILMDMIGNEDTLVIVPVKIPYKASKNDAAKIMTVLDEAMEGRKEMFLNPQNASENFRTFASIIEKRDMKVIKIAENIINKENNFAPISSWNVSLENNYDTMLDSYTLKNQEILDKNKDIIMQMAVSAILNGFKENKPLRINPANFPDELQRFRGAVTVTILKNDEIRGIYGFPIVGKIADYFKPMIADVAGSAYQAAFSTPNFPPLQKEEIPLIDIKVSILTEPFYFKVEDRNDLIAKIRENQDGLLMFEKGRFGFILPDEWLLYKDKETMLNAVRLNGGMDKDIFDNEARIAKFSAASIRLSTIRKYKDIWEKQVEQIITEWENVKDNL